MDAFPVLEFRQSSLQDSECLGIGVTDDHHLTGFPGDMNGTVQLLINGLGVLFGIKEDIPFGGRDGLFPGHIHSNTVGSGATVHEEQICPPELLHQPGHGARVAGQQAAHMIVYALHAGDRRQAATEGGPEDRLVHVELEAARSQQFVEGAGLKRQVKQYVLAAFRALLCQPAGMGCVGENGAADGDRQAGDTEVQIRAITHVINDDGDPGTGLV